MTARKVCQIRYNAPLLPVWLTVLLLAGGACPAMAHADDDPALRRISAPLPHSESLRDLAAIAKRYSSGDESPFSAGERLVAAESRWARESGDPPESMRDLAVWYVQLGLRNRATLLTRQWPADQYNRFWLEQARVMLRQDTANAAQQALQNLSEPLTPAQEETRQSLLGLSFMQQHRYADAVRTLEGKQGFPRTSLFDHFNYGVSLIGQGRMHEGMALLDEIGAVLAEDGAVLVLRDRTNLTLGWAWLSLHEGGSARYYFKRVSLNGSHSGVALLGLGWAELAPDGSIQKANFRRELRCADIQAPPTPVTLLLFKSRGDCRPGDKPAVFKFNLRFGYESGVSGPARFHAALTPWLELSQRSAHDPAVQEALLAIGYAYAEIKADAQAERAYRSAVQRFQAELERLAGFEAALRKPGANPISVIEQRAYPGELTTLRGSHRYVQISADLQTLRLIAKKLEDAQNRAEQTVEPGNELQTRRARKTRAIIDLRSAIYLEVTNDALEDLAARRSRLQEYLTRARLALAALYDAAGQ